MSNPYSTYEFYINGTQVFPVYNQLSKVYEKETDQEFFRISLDGKLKLLGADFDLINNSAFNTKFNLIVNQYDGTNYNSYYTGYFYKVDCDFDFDNSELTVSPSTTDQYTDVLFGMDNKYNLINLSPSKTPIQIQKRPLLQIYLEGDTKLTNFVGGNAWDQEVTLPVVGSDLQNVYYFTQGSSYLKYTVTVNTSNATPDMLGAYAGSGSVEVYGRKILDQSGENYKIAFTYTTDWTLQLIRVSDGVILFSGTAASNPFVPPYTINLAAVDASYTGSVTVTLDIVQPVWYRFLLDASSVGGTPTNSIPTDDIVANNSNYLYVIGFSGGALVSGSPNVTIAQGEFGQTSDGYYYAPPDLINTYYPVIKSEWSNDVGIWFQFTSAVSSIEETYRVAQTIPDCFMISEVISALLKKVDPTLSHEGTSDYSQFLYSGTNPIDGSVYQVALSPKSNTIATYDLPAQKAETTLKQILTILRDTFKLYWYVENNKLKIEHIEFFRNYGTYVGTPVTIANLTTMLHPRHQKPYSFGQNRVSYDKQEISQRIEFSWQDNVSPAFEGYPIEITSGFATKGKIDTIQINCTSDIDFILADPSNISKDGFTLFTPIWDSGNSIWKLPFVNFSADNRDYILQNGYASLIYLLPTYWNYDLPTSDVNMNNVVFTNVQGVKKTMSQEVEFPSDTDPASIGVVITDLGSGQINKISIDLSSRLIKATLKYDAQ